MHPRSVIVMFYQQFLDERKSNQGTESSLKSRRHQSLSATDENGVRPERKQWDRTALWSEAFEKRCLRLISRKQVWELQKPKEGFPRLWIYHSLWKTTGIRAGSRKDIMLQSKMCVFIRSGSIYEEWKPGSCNFGDVFETKSKTP